MEQINNSATRRGRPRKDAVTGIGIPSSSSSSSSSSTSSSGDSLNFSSTSSNESDSEDSSANVKKNGIGSCSSETGRCQKLKSTPGPELVGFRNPDTSGSRENVPKKVVASGFVVNDEIRVVPVKERKKPITPREKPTPRDLKERKFDPTFKASCHPSSSKRRKQRYEPFGSDSSDGEEVTPRRESLRKRTSTSIMNEKFLFDLQHKNFVEESNNARIKREKKQKKVEEVDLDMTEEIDAEAPATNLRLSGRTADWDDFLKSPVNFTYIVPVNFFKHAPCSSIWDKLAVVGMKIELPIPFVVCNRPVYWVGTIKAFAGYKALVQYETFGMKPAHFGWISFCSCVPKPIGYCDKNRILLFPPEEIYLKRTDFLLRIRNILKEDGIVTLTDAHLETITKHILACRKFQISEPVEALDCQNYSQNLIGEVTGVIGDRVHVTYNIKTESTGFWFNVNSDKIHKIGWSQTVGHVLMGVPKETEFVNLEDEHFPKYPEDMKIKLGMVLEVIHPFHVNRIVAATVTEILKHGYFMVQTNCNLTKLFICFHLSSASILPIGFSKRNNIPLGVPCDEIEDSFCWETYCLKKQVVPLDLSSLPQRPQHKFTTGNKMEAVDLRQPTFCGPVTIIKVAEHLLLIHFDGWERDNPQALQWVDAESAEIYPVGWTEMVGHEFQSTPTIPQPEDRPVVLRHDNELKQDLQLPGTSKSFV